MCKEITEKVKSWYCKESSRTGTLLFTVWVFHQNELGKNCGSVRHAKMDKIVVRNSNNKSNNNNGDMLGACSRLRSLLLSLVAWCVSCDNSNNSNNNNNNNNNMMMMMKMMIMID